MGPRPSEKVASAGCCWGPHRGAVGLPCMSRLMATSTQLLLGEEAMRLLPVRSARKAQRAEPCPLLCPSWPSLRGAGWQGSSLVCRVPSTLSRVQRVGFAERREHNNCHSGCQTYVGKKTPVVKD